MYTNHLIIILVVCISAVVDIDFTQPSYTVSEDELNVTISVRALSELERDVLVEFFIIGVDAISGGAIIGK